MHKKEINMPQEMNMSDQAVGAVMMALQKSLMEQSDIVPVLKEFNFKLSDAVFIFSFKLSISFEISLSCCFAFSLNAFLSICLKFVCVVFKKLVPADRQIWFTIFLS